jgi:glycosyltransferase involved in cell wall biosynthesis
MREGITVIIPSFRRHENIPIIINRLKNQTLKPEKIIIWNDNSGEFAREFTTKEEGVEVINTNSNYYTFGAYLAAYTSNTSYVAIIDDDMAPGPKWLEFCYKTQKTTPGLYGSYGVIFTSKNSYAPNRHMKSKCVLGGKLLEVDMIGTSYFFPYKAVNCFLAERPPAFPSITDMHLCYTSQKYGNFKIYLIYPNEEEELPLYNKSELKLDSSQNAGWRDNYHYINRTGYLRWATKRGWNLIMDRGGYREEDIPI